MTPEMVNAVVDIYADQSRLNATLLAENVYLLETLKALAERDELAAHLLREFEKVRTELRGANG